jgi:hypothetical protein
VIDAEALYLYLPLNTPPAPVHFPGLSLVESPRLSAEASVAGELANLRTRAQDLELAFKFREAAEVWKEIYARLKLSRALLTDPRSVAEAAINIGSAFAEAGEREAALQHFRIALAIDAGIVPGGAYAPRVRALFDEAALLGPSLAPAPSAEAMGALAKEGGMKAMLWVSVGQDADGPVWVRRLYMEGKPPSAEVRRRLGPQGKNAQAVLEAERLALKEAFFPAAENVSTKTDPPPVDPPPPGIDWGAVVLWSSVGLVGLAAAAGATGGILAWTLGEDQVDPVVHH